LNDLLGIFTDNILPIVIVVAIGFALQKSLKLNPRPLSQATFYVLSPALIFSVLVNADISENEILRMMGYAALILLIVGAISWGMARGMKLSNKMTSAFVLSSTFMNAGNFGMSLNLFAYGELGLTWAGLFFVSNALMVNSLGVYIASLGTHSPRQALIGLLKVPVLHAVILGLLVRSISLEVPSAIMRPIQLLGDASIPVMLLILGMQISLSGFPRQKLPLSLATFNQLILSPGVALLLVPLFSLSGIARKAGIIEAAMPAAVFNTIISIEYDVEPDFVTGVVFTSTILSPLTLTVFLALLG
jgi:predicted permease